MATSLCLSRPAAPVVVPSHPTTPTLHDPLGSPGAATSERLARARERAAGHPQPTQSPPFILEIGEFGIGMFAARDIVKDEMILEFCGPSLTFEEAIAMGEGQCYALQVGLDREYINLDEPGCFVNHSCSPNTGLRNLWLVALHAIRMGEEIRFDYSTTMAEDHWEMSCRCDSPNCRGRVRDFRHLPAALQEHYRTLGIAAPFLA